MAKIEANNAIGAIKGIFGLGIENAAGYGAKTTFLGKTGSSLTIMQNGEHWFHTAEQMTFLDNWIKSKI